MPVKSRTAFRTALEFTLSVTESPPAATPLRDQPPPRAGHAASRAAGLAVAALALVVVVVLSIAVGAKPIPLTQVWAALTDPGAVDYAVVHDMRLPRTLLGLLAGLALGTAGAAMQALTRNPLADPGLLGINAGAAAAIATASLLFGVGGGTGQVWFALGGAAAVTVGVYAVGGGRTATPARLALAGAALNAALYSYVSAVMLLDSAGLQRLRFWTVGSLASADDATVRRVLPFIAVGLVAALAAARPLNALALGDDTARALGARPAWIRAAVIAAITLLCGAATAACGPIVFVGLLVPHLVRTLTGPDLRWLLPYCALLAPVLLLGADVLGRVLGRPGELQVGLVTAVLGGPLFLWLVTRTRTARP
ncbi:Fe(3+)-hydroxamate ABC transporter permease FhuB [Verrucosispora sp. ts21]|uniref:Iron ABC transporter permease n=1 Tax=Micromonospora maris TaxID=1003110 RepID=A0A9X0I0N5_9ACTN|nr:MULTISPECIES: iron chelate uptake ABC transporter family permease subunit [Micromonospora]KUJ44566.1 iron ABC transporter permease [Micromonospora maris]PMR62839.1 Fe(3+)-hydroxamate ABC transporter permease FhuB [Verrucosispora sp. ts21]